MEKTLSQEEIDALFNNADSIQNSSDTNAVEVDQEKIDELSNYLYNQNQDFINSMIEEKNASIDEVTDKIDELSNYLYNQNQDFINSMIEEKNDSIDEMTNKIDELSNYLYNQNQDFIKDIIAERENNETDKYSDEELEYMNSPYYLNLYNLIANIDQVADSFIQNITYAVMQRRYCDKCNCSFCIYNIGFPVPDRFLKQFKLSLKMKLEQLIQIEGWGNMNIDIKPVKYSNQYSCSENLYKQTNYYIIDVSLKKVKSDINFIKK